MVILKHLQITHNASPFLLVVTRFCQINPPLAPCGLLISNTRLYTHLRCSRQGSRRSRYTCREGNKLIEPEQELWYELSTTRLLPKCGISASHQPFPAKTYSFLPNALNAFHPCMVPSAPHLQHTPFFDHGPSPMPRNP